MMSKVKQFTADERAQVNEKIENAFAFIEDVIEDPSALDHIPDKTTIVLTPVDRQAARGNYITETKRFAVSVSNGRRKSPPAADAFRGATGAKRPSGPWARRKTAVARHASGMVRAKHTSNSRRVKK